MILPCASRWMRSMGWRISERTWTTSRGLMLDGRRSLPLPRSDMALPSAPADGDLHLALHLKEAAVALLDDRAYVARLAEPDVRAHERAAGLGGERDARNDGDAVLVGHDVDVLHVAGRRHRRVDSDRDRHHRAVLGDERHVELDDGRAVLDRPGAEEPVHPVLH